MFVKICGITTADALAAALAAGADAVGFVFAESPRRVSPGQARELCAGLPAAVIRIAVMRHPTAADVADVLSTFAPDWLQTEAEDFASIALPADCAALPVYRNGRLPAGFLATGPEQSPGLPAEANGGREAGVGTGPGTATGHGNGVETAADSAAAAIPARLLFEGQTSGTGRTADWDEARRLAAKTELVLAGGLDPENVADAIRAVRPWGVDVSSGVEASRGIKDPEKIARFVARVRAVENEK